MRDFNKASLYGHGCYFSTAAQYSFDYFSRKTGANSTGANGNDKTLLMCRLLRGTSFEGKPGITALNRPKDPKTDAYYDTLHNGPDEEYSSIYVTQRDYMAYPEFVLTFSEI